jgi:hypothetical protein
MGSVTNESKPKRANKIGKSARRRQNKRAKKLTGAAADAVPPMKLALCPRERPSRYDESPDKYPIKWHVPMWIQKKFVRATSTHKALAAPDSYDEPYVLDASTKQMSGSALKAVYGVGAKLVLEAGYTPGGHLGTRPGLTTPLQAKYTNLRKHKAAVSLSRWEDLCKQAMAYDSYLEAEYELLL